MLFKSIILCLLVASPALGSAIKGYASRAEEAAPTKGLHREEPTKGGRLLAPAEQYRAAEASKTAIAHQAKLEVKEEKKVEQRAEEFQQVAEQQQQKLEDLSQQKQEQLHEPEAPLTQQRVEAEAPPTKTVRYEAKPQIVQVREEAPAPLAKGQKQQPLATIEPQRIEQVESAAKGQAKIETVKQEQQKQVSFEQEKLEQRETYAEQQQQQQVEIRQEPLQQEQRRLDESQLRLEQQQQQQLLATEEIQEIRQEQVQVQQHQAVKGGPAPLGQAEPYAFEYSVDGSSRRESGDTNGVVRGQYTLQGADGSSRIVDYVADRDGFRASVNTNEFGTEARSPAGVELRSSQPEAQDISLRLEGKTREFLNPPQPIQQQPLFAVKGAAAPLPLVAAVPAKPENWQATKTQAHREQQQQQLLVAEPEAPRATKGSSYKLEEQQQLPVKAPPAPAAASKGETEPKQQEQIELVQASGPSIDRRPIADYRAPKAIVQTAPIRASAFESATAHRQQPVISHRPAYLQPSAPVVHHQPAPAVPLRPVAPARSHYRQPPAPQRVHYQAERHYPQPAASAYRRPIVGEQQPRALNIDDETLNLNFDRSS